MSRKHGHLLCAVDSQVDQETGGTQQTLQTISRKTVKTVDKQL